MPMMPCPDCPERVSTRAHQCPKCGCAIQESLRGDLAERALGFPLGPIKFWGAYFRRYWASSQTEQSAPEGWVSHGDPLVSLSPKTNLDGGVVIRGHLEGMVLRQQIEITNPLDLGYELGDQTHFLVLRPRRRYASRTGKAFERFRYYSVYEPLRDAIHSAVEEYPLVSRFFGPSYEKFDPHRRFGSKGEVIAAADKLMKVDWIWLPNWDFESINPTFQATPQELA